LESKEVSFTVQWLIREKLTHAKQKQAKMMNVLHEILSIAVGVTWTTMTSKVSNVKKARKGEALTNTDPVYETCKCLASSTDARGGNLTRIEPVLWLTLLYQIERFLGQGEEGSIPWYRQISNAQEDLEDENEDSCSISTIGATDGEKTSDQHKTDTKTSGGDHKGRASTEYIHTP
jgi:hypothetical protein